MLKCKVLILNLAGESSLFVFQLFVSQPSLLVYSICRSAPHGKSVIKTNRLNLVYHFIGCCWLWIDFTVVLVSFFIDISQHFFLLILPQRRRYWILNPPLLEVRVTYYCNFKFDNRLTGFYWAWQFIPNWCATNICKVCPMECRPGRWKKKLCTISQIIWNFPYYEEVPNESGVSSYSIFFVNFR